MGRTFKKKTIFDKEVEVPRSFCTARVRTCKCGQTFTEREDDVTVCPKCNLDRVFCGKAVSMDRADKCMFHINRQQFNSLQRKKDKFTSQLDLYVSEFNRAATILEESGYKVNRDMFRELALGNTIEIVNDIIRNPDIAPQKKLDAIKQAVDIDTKTSAQIKQVSVNSLFFVVVSILNIVMEVLRGSGHSDLYREIFAMCNDRIQLPVIDMAQIDLKAVDS